MALRSPLDGLQDDELVAAEPGDEMPAGDVADALPGGDQQRVAGRVAERIVDRLELVEIEAVQREQRLAVLERPVEMVELLLEHGPVRQAGQHVVERQMRDPPLALLDLVGHFVEARRQPGELVVAAHLRP